MKDPATFKSTLMDNGELMELEKSKNKLIEHFEEKKKVLEVDFTAKIHMIAEAYGDVQKSLKEILEVTQSRQQPILK